MRAVKCLGYVGLSTVGVFLSLACHANPLERLLDKKWSLGDLKCDLNGGAYTVYSEEAVGGSTFYAGGKPTGSSQPQWHRYTVLDKDTVRYERRIYADNNSMMVQSLGSPATLVAKDIQIIKLEGNEKLSKKTEITSLDLTWVLKNRKPKYVTKLETSSSRLCP